MIIISLLIQIITTSGKIIFIDRERTAMSVNPDIKKIRCMNEMKIEGPFRLRAEWALLTRPSRFVTAMRRHDRRTRYPSPGREIKELFLGLTASGEINRTEIIPAADEAVLGLVTSSLSAGGPRNQSIWRRRRRWWWWWSRHKMPRSRRRKPFFLLGGLQASVRRQTIACQFSLKPRFWSHQSGCALYECVWSRHVGNICSHYRRRITFFPL